MSIYLQKIKHQNQQSIVLFEEIDHILASYNQPSLTAETKDKIFYEKKFSKDIFVILENNHPVGIVWIELTTPHYGSLTIYIKHKSVAYPTMMAIKDADFFNKKIIEVASFLYSDEIKQACFDLKLVPNIRKRMYLWMNQLNEEFLVKQPSQKHSFLPYTKEDTAWSSKLSVASHFISKDYEFYEEMINVSKRKHLEDQVWKGLYGSVLESASLILCVDGVTIGYCLVVLVECWGYPQVPWVFDICIDPQFQGKGWGKFLANEMVSQIKQEGFEIMGLAVTLSNSSAQYIYQNQGFCNLDVFYEFTDP